MTHRLIRVALVGAAGYWAGNLRRVLGRSDRFTVRALIDPRLDPGLNTFRSLDEMPDNWVEAVCIATPAPSHTALALDALESGLHVLVEKPLALSSSDGEKLCAAARAHDRVLMCDLTYLGSGPVATLATVLPVLKPVESWTSVRAHMGGPRDVSSLWDLVVHDLAILRGLVPEWNPTTVLAWGSAEDGGATWTSLQHIVTLSWSRQSPEKIREVLMVCGETRVSWDDLAATPILVGGIEVPILGAREPLAAIVDDFADAIEGKPTRLVARPTGAFACYGLRLVEAAARSIDSGKVEQIS